MKKLTTLPIILILLLSLTACTGDAVPGLLQDGNQAFQNQDYDTALTAYQSAQTQNPALAEPHYNEAGVHYRQGDFEQAQKSMLAALPNAQSPLAAQGFYNLGNSFYNSQQLDEAIEAYKSALRLNPDDQAAKHNLELALQQKEQQEQQEQQQDQENQDEQAEQDDQTEENQDESQSDDAEQDESPPDEQQSQDGESGEDESESEQSEAQDSESENETDQSQDEPQSESQDQNGEEAEQPAEEDSQQDGQPSQPQPGEPGNEEAQPYPVEVTGLTPEQAAQLLQAAAENGQTLQEALQQIMTFRGPPPAQDW